MITLLNELRRELANCVDEYRTIRGRLFKILLYAFLASLLAVGLNFLGMKTANAMIGCILPFVALYMFSSPEVIGGVVIAGLITSPRHPVIGVKGVAELVGQALAWIVLVTSMFFLVVGTLPLGRNFWAIWIVYLCAGILMMMDVQGVRKTRFVTGLLYSYAIVALVVSLGSMIPGPVHVKMYGHDLFSWLRISPVENALARVEDAETGVNEKAITAALAVIEKKIKKGQDLTTNDLFIKAYAKAARDENTAPAKAKEAWRGMFPIKPISAKATTGSTMPALAGKTLLIELRPDQVYDIDDLRQGQHWRYLSFNGTFEHRIDKGDGQACWKVVDNNLPWFADCAGKLQVKAGNTPVKLTVNVVP